jgi:hypothetical protein
MLHGENFFVNFQQQELRLCDEQIVSFATVTKIRGLRISKFAYTGVGQLVIQKMSAHFCSHHFAPPILVFRPKLVQ